MNRAASVFASWFTGYYPDQLRPVVIMAGTGNNGGDGVAVARLLHNAQFAAKLAVCDFDTRHSADFDLQMTLLPQEVTPVMLKNAGEADTFLRELPKNTLFIDALFGSGLNRPLSGDWASLAGLSSRGLCQ